MTEHWECHFCTALNTADKQQCWKCAKSRTQTEIASAQSHEAASAAQAKAELLARKRAESEARALALSTEGRLDLRTQLARYEGSSVSINYPHPVKAADALLVSAQADHIELRQGPGIIRVPYEQILRLVERESDGTGKSAIALEIFHLIIYKGSVGVGMSIPI